MYCEFTTDAMFSQRFKRVASALVLFFFSFTFYSPAVQAAFSEFERKNQVPRNTLEYINPLGQTLESMHEQVARISETLNGLDQENSDSREQVERQLERLEAMRDTFSERDLMVREQLSSEAAAIDRAQLSDQVRQRHDDFEQNYLEHVEAINATLDHLESWSLEDHADYAVLANHLKELKGLVGDKVRDPQQSYSNDLDFVSPPPRPLYTNQSQINGLLDVSGTPSWSMTAYLETDAATAAGDQVQQLLSNTGVDPLTIYQSIKDSIRFIPSYGVMQGAEYTLESQQGNAFDIASALISAYREAGIPARYRYGTVALPADAIQNWVGGVTNLNAATNILSQGGIPQQQLSYGGAAEEVEIEHVWVEAWINGQWIALDPSFKQHTFDEGMDIETAVPLDAQGFLSDLQASATVNEAEGWVQGLDAGMVQSRMDDYQTEVEAYIDSQDSNATLGDVLGTQQIVPDETAYIEDVTLPYERVEASAVVPNLPESLYYRFKLQVGSTTGGSFGMPVQWAGVAAELDKLTPELVGKSIAISFRPATEADQQTLASYLPENPESVEDLPNQLPANTIRMIGELTVDGEVIDSTPTVTLGQALMVRLGYDSPQHGWRFSENNLVAGKYQAVGIDMQGISPEQLETLQQKLEQVKDQLDAEDYQGLTKHDLVGGILQAGIQGYLAETYAMDKLAAHAADIVYHRSPSYGTFSTQMNVSYLFGMPRNVFFSGVVMDVDQVSSNTESVDNCYEDWVAFNRSSGMRSSAYEHLIPERLFSTEEEPAEGVSTAKALALAMAEGQKIYTLTEDNAASLSLITIDSEARSEIQTALQRGFEVTVHEQPINVNGWEGSGYSIIDPEHGVGAYKISGGISGGEVSDIISAIAAALLGWVSGSLDHLNNIKPIFSETLKYWKKVHGYAKGAGALGLIAGLIGALTGDAQGWNLVGQLSSVVFGFAATAILVSSIALAVGPVLGAVFGAVVAGLISYLMASFSRRFFG